MNELSTGLVKHSLSKAEEGRIKDDSTGHVLMAVSRVGTTDQQGDSVQPGKVHKAETRKETSHVHVKESRDSSRLREQFKSLKGGGNSLYAGVWCGGEQQEMG